MQKSKIKNLLAILTVAIVLCSFCLYSKQKEKHPYKEKITVAMDTVVSQKIYGGTADEHTQNIADIIDSLDKTISRFTEGSAVETLNSEGSVTDSHSAYILSLMKEVSEKSEGVFDVTVGEVSSLWSIGENSGNIPDEEDIQKALSKVDYSLLEIDGDSVILKSGAKVDLGAVGKGYACDLVKAYLEEKNADGAIVSVGGSILAFGDYNNCGDKWKIAIQHPRDKESYLGVLSVDEGFVSTSGDYERYFEKDGVRYHHILDATTGYPASSGVISVTVICDKGILSDALSTVCFILGYEKSLPVLEYYGAKAIFVDESLNISYVGDVDFEVFQD